MRNLSKKLVKWYDPEKRLHVTFLNKSLRDQYIAKLCQSEAKKLERIRNFQMRIE